LSVAFSPDGKTLASGSHLGTITLRDVQTGKVRATLKATANCVVSVAYSPDGKTLASGSGMMRAGATDENQTLKLWDVATGKNTATIQGDTNSFDSVAFSPDGKTLASGTTQTIKLWDMPAANQNAAEPPKKDAGTDMKKLAQARVDAAHKAYRVAVKLVQERIPGARLEDVYSWSVRWLNAQRDLSSNKKDHLSALGEHLKRMQELAQVAGAFTKTGQGSPLDSPAADFYLREAELWLAQAKATAKQADK